MSVGTSDHALQKYSESMTIQKLTMQRENGSDIRNQIDIEVVFYSQTPVRRTEIHVVIFLKTIIFRAD